MKKSHLRQIIKEEISKLLSEKVYKVYHGTNDKFNNFDLNKTSQQVIWFTDNIDSIKNSTHGGDGNKYILTRYITLNNPATWGDYEKYSIGELINLGYDGVILPEDGKTDYIIFDTKNIKEVNIKNEDLKKLIKEEIIKTINENEQREIEHSHTLVKHATDLVNQMRIVMRKKGYNV